MALGQCPQPAGHWDSFRQEPFPRASDVPHQLCCPSQAVLCWGAVGLWCLHLMWVSPVPAACASVGGTMGWQPVLQGSASQGDAQGDVLRWSWAAQGFFEATHVPVGVSRHCPALLSPGSHSIPVSQGCVLTINGLQGQELARKDSPGSALGIPVWAASPAGHRALGCPVKGTSVGWDAGPQGMRWDTEMRQAFMGWDVQM